MKPIKPLQFALTRDKYLHIIYSTSYSHGDYLIQYDLYMVHIKKFEKLFRDCTIERMEEVII